jgi:hypothetical protein
MALRKLPNEQVQDSGKIGTSAHFVTSNSELPKRTKQNLQGRNRRPGWRFAFLEMEIPVSEPCFQIDVRRQDNALPTTNGCDPKGPSPFLSCLRKQTPLFFHAT